MNFATIKENWFSNVRADFLSGLTVAFALIPEAIGFSIIAGVDPMVGIYASVLIAIVIAFTGGRPGMISAATGATAVLMVSLVHDRGIQYLFAATIVTGLIQIVFGMLKIGRLLSFLPNTVLTGFVNALAIVIFMAQLPQFVGATWLMYAMVAATLIVIYLFPYLTRIFPAALFAIIVMTIISIVFKLDLKTVGDMGTITQALPAFHLPSVPFSIETLAIVFPTSLAIAVVGLTESLVTATIVDEFTGTGSDKNKEARGQGYANIVSGLFGGMAGCGMIGQSVINVQSGGRKRLSTLTAGVFLIVLIMLFGDVVKQIPMAALVGVMIMVSIGTFDWQSVRKLHKYPVSDAIIMILTVAVVVYTSNLAIGVALGVAMSAIVFGWKMAKLTVMSRTEENHKTYSVSGQLFFATTSQLLQEFDYENDPEKIVIDFSLSHVWDHSSAAAIAKAVSKYNSLDKKVTLTGLNKESSSIIDRIGLDAISNH
ncbi:SulP family inorganic anion transporter [Metabacillus sp. GX 13764]|uniref:SulP family inorganic anion transporter n=1 Tax=Metabacillus kandeliae TaxID=2900151 RepID=UPI001E3E2A7E|nr:SulP family inorganic anion transporter [Metabacillus kandeliae]MCD7034088.1 SulP family inorganic anion transporter [Metabacillus kandeliae]